MQQLKRHYPLIAAILAALAVYLPFLANPFVYDDFHSLSWNQALRSWDQLPALFTDPQLFS